MDLAHAKYSKRVKREKGKCWKLQREAELIDEFDFGVIEQ